MQFFIYRDRMRGFTLIELLVVIAIIGFISSIVLASINSARAKARDARRISDMKQLMLVMELYYDDNNVYPGPVAFNLVENMDSGGSDITPYINPLPQDPIHTGGNGYQYTPSNSARQAYSMLVQLEKNDGAWCSINVNGGHPSWNGDPSDGGGTNHPPCEFGQ